MITRIEEDKIILEPQSDSERYAISELREDKAFDSIYFLLVKQNGTLIFSPMAPRVSEEPSLEVCVEDVVKTENERVG